MDKLRPLYMDSPESDNSFTSRQVLITSTESAKKKQRDLNSADRTKEIRKWAHETNILVSTFGELKAKARRTLIVKRFNRQVHPAFPHHSNLRTQYPTHQTTIPHRIEHKQPGESGEGQPAAIRTPGRTIDGALERSKDACAGGRGQEDAREMGSYNEEYDLPGKKDLREVTHSTETKVDRWKHPSVRSEIAPAGEEMEPTVATAREIGCWTESKDASNMRRR
ncbi:hypothetical protein C8R44DRAFT_745520 [Mycena epipterygia]|nr:hypothetical protein C8R44DRAFT_745520 [Mycena epipterygia]